MSVAAPRRGLSETLLRALRVLLCPSNAVSGTDFLATGVGKSGFLLLAVAALMGTFICSSGCPRVVLCIICFAHFLAMCAVAYFCHICGFSV